MHYYRWKRQGDPLVVLVVHRPGANCSIPGCPNPHVARGWCDKHWQRWRSTGDPLRTKPGTAPERFWAKVDRRGDDECWPWLGAVNPNGYGAFQWDGGQYAHRFAYELQIGPIPEGLTLDHLCRVRHCVNGAHLEPVTGQENTLRGYQARAEMRASDEAQQRDAGG
jgi:hypothetical protein